jgi:enoyl-CoA hydratase
MVDAVEAERMGLVSRVVPDGEVVDAALEVARQVRANSPFGVWMTKEVMWSNLETGSMQAAIDLENRTQILTSFTEDQAEAMAGFLEKREPRWRYG